MKLSSIYSSRKAKTTIIYCEIYNKISGLCVTSAIVYSLSQAAKWFQEHKINMQDVITKGDILSAYQ